MEKQPRPLAELYQVMIDNIDLINPFSPSGMCGLIHRLSIKGIISSCEEYRIEIDLEINKPLNSNAYWFPRGEKQPRIEWMQNRIKELKSN